MDVYWSTGEIEAMKHDLIIVYSAAGRSRSATIVIAYLMRWHKWGISTAKQVVSAKRVVFPNQGFVAQLRV